MANTQSIIEIIENLAPPELAAEWDKSGWQVNLNNKETSKIMLTLSVTLDVVKQAIEQGCDLIISHHPCMFTKLNTIDASSNAQLPIIKAIQNNIQIYSAHTNLDRANGGIADILCEQLGINNTTELYDFVKLGEIKSEISLDEFISKVKEILNIDKVKLINPSNIQKIKKAALCPGSGGDFATQITNADVYITGDIKYHTAIEIIDIAVIDAGHFESERIILPIIKDLLGKTGVEIVIAKEQLPWQIL